MEQHFSPEVSATAAVGNILSNPRSQTWVGGRRPIWKRPLAMLKWLAVSTMLTSGIMWSGLGDEMVARLSTVSLVAPAPAKVSWVEHTNPMMDVGRRADGSLARQHLFRSWKAAGFSLDDARAMIRASQDALPIVMGREDPALRAQLIAEQEQLLSGIRQARPEEFARLEQEVKKPFGSRRQSNWSDEDREILNLDWDFYITDPAIERRNTDASIFQSRKKLEEAVLEVGARALKVSWSDWESPSRLMWLAENLQEANRDLQKATGWEGALLGLNGTAVIQLARPQPELGAGGVAEIRSDGVIYLTAEWTALGHEWLHGLDFYSGQVVPRAPLPMTLSEQSKRPLRFYNDFSQGLSWKRLVKGIEDVSPVWFDYKRQVTTLDTASSLDGLEGYWLRPSETLAFAFQMMLSNNPDVKVLTVPKEHLEKDRNFQPYRYPSNTEMERQTTLWETFFQVNQSLLETPSLAQLRQARQARQEAAHVEPPSRSRSLRACD